MNACSPSSSGKPSAVLLEKPAQLDESIFIFMVAAFWSLSSKLGQVGHFAYRPRHLDIFTLEVKALFTDPGIIVFVLWQGRVTQELAL